LFDAHLNVSILERLIGLYRAQLCAAIALDDAFYRRVRRH
jgi:hypothetical protein